MKKKNTMPERDWQQTHEKIRRRELRKRILVMGLTVAMVANTVDLSALSVSAKTDESETGKTTIVSFEELSKDITEQTLPIGALESDIKFPTSLTVTVEKTTQADEKEADDEEDASETRDTEKDDAQKDDSNGDTASSDDKKDTESSDEKDGDSGNADASETGDTEKDDAQKDDSNGDTASSDDKKDTESSDEKDGDSGNADASDKSGASDNGNADTKDSDTSKDSGNSDKSNNPNGSSSSDTEDTQARADLPSAFGALIGQMADALLPYKLIVYAAEKDDASDTASTSDGADNAKKTDTASTSDNADSVKTTGSSDAAASSETETTTEKIRLKNIKWELNVEESDAEEFDSSEASNGFCYAYTPVLPDEDGDGNQLVLGKDVELPTIYVLVGEYGIALLAGSGTVQITETNADGTKAPYTAQDLATWIDEHGSANLKKVSIKLLNDDTSITEELTIGTGLAKEIELDLNGHTLTLQGGNARLYFKRVNITITSSGSNKGTITGNYDNGNKIKGDGLVTADYDSILKIERVTIKNAGTGSTVALWNGVTCTIDAASISGSSGDQVGTITIDNGKACTITNTEVTGNVGAGYGTIMFMDSCSDCIISEGAVIKNENSGGYCVKVTDNYNVKITVKKGATLTANAGRATIMNTSYSNVAVNIEGGTFNGRLRLPDNSQIAEGTFTPASASGNAIWVNNPKNTLQDLLKVGYTLQYEDGTYADLTARWTDEGRKVTAVKSPLYFTTHPTISSGAETVMENYTASEAPTLTVKAESGSGSISYQWYADETINGTTTKVEQTGQGAKTATYRIPTGLLAGTYQYYCVATCGEYTATSKKAAFTVEEGVAEVTVGGNTTRYATLTKAFDAVKATVNAADADADLEITLKILKNISETGSEWKIDEGTKKVSFCMDLNGCTVTGKGLYITGEGVEAVFKGAGTGQNGTLNAPVSIQNKAKLMVENGNYKGVLRFVNGAAAKLKDGYYSSSIYIGKTEGMDNTDISCTITGGTYEGEEVLVCGGATLSVSGDTAKIKALHIDHREFSQIKRAKVMLSGGEYGEIALSNFGENDDSLLDKTQGYAIADTLEEGYAFYSAGIKTDISRTDRSQGSVKVLRADMPEDTSQAVVKFQIEKNSGETKTMYFLTWDAAMFYLEESKEHKKNEEYKLWKKLEILLLKDTIAGKSINRMLNKVYLPAEITLRSEGNEPHTLTGRGNYLFMTGGQDVTIENINVVGNIDFLGDTRGTQAQDAAVLRLGERATGLENISVTGNAEIVIEKGAEIPKTFTGDGGNLNASIYCNHDSADFSSKITKGASAFKVWFPIELGGIALPTGGENDTNVTQRDGVTYGLYSNGGTTGQKIKVTGEVCSYEPYGGNAVTIDTTDLSFTMPSSKVTLKTHTKDDYGYCSKCKRTDLETAKKNEKLIIEGLEGRIYDGYPQVMTGITLKTANGDVKLTGPEYKSGKELAQDSTGSANADITNAEYTVVYENNIKCNENKESTDAPTAIITGRGAYYGTVAFKFAIGQGEMQVAGATAAATEYDGKAHTALADSDAISVTLKADKYDANAHIPVTDGYIAPCLGKKLATDGFDSEYMDTFPLQITCKGADGKAYGDANTYTVTNAGSYPFKIIVMPENNSCPSVVIPLTAKITPRPITIKVENMHRTYGEIFPGMEKLKFKIVNGTLAAGDTKEEFWKELDFWTDAEATKPDGDAGKWAFGIKEASTSGRYSTKVEGYYEAINNDDPAAVTRENGFLYTDKAQGEFVKLAGYQDNWSVSYGADPFSLAVKTNNIHDNLPEYTVIDAKDANGNDIDEADIATRLLSVSREGEVTIKGAGSATIKLLYPTAINYTAAKPLTVKVNIAQAYWNPPNIYRDFLFLRGGSDSIDLAALLPKDCGGVTYDVVKTSDSKSILEGVSVSQDGRLSYTVKTGGAVGDAATITVPVSTANYNINTNQGILVVIKLIDQLPVQLKGGISLKKAALTYGEALSSLQFNSATFADKVSGKTVPGKLSFDEPDKKPDAGDYNAAWTFTPTDDAYAKCKGMITVSVKKAVPKVVSVPIPEAYYYSPTGIAADWCQSHAQKPGEVRGADGAMLDGIWCFKEASLVPKPGTNAYPVIFTPTDTKNYETIEKTVTLTVKKAMPYISTQPAIANAYTHGDYLYNQTLAGAAIYGNGMGSTGTGTGAAASVAGTFKWKAPSTKLTYLGNKTFEYLFTPEDTASYEAVTGSVTVTVNQAQAAPFMPGSKMNVAKFCETVGSVKLPQGWKWDDADAAKALVEDDGTGGNVTSATAVYDGADKGSYKEETVTIQITRASCEHAKKEVKGAVKATCIAEGTTGETWCLVCGKKLDDGVATPKDTANHTNLVSRQLRPATTTQEGIMSYACSGCGYYAEKAIEKLVSGGSSSTGSSNSSGSSSGHHSGSTGSNLGRKDSTAAQSANQAPAPTPAAAPMPVPAPAPAQPANPIRSQGNAAAEQGEQAMPFIRGEDGKEGWEVIKAETAARAEGERVTVDMNGASVVPGDVFDEIRGKNVTIEFDLGGGISWSVNGKSVSDKVGDIDFRVTYGEEASDAIPVDLINALTGERTSMNVTLAYEGRFGFEAVLRINVGAANQGLVANLFYYNESTRELEFISAGEVDAEGFAYLRFTHASDYTIVLDEASMEEAALTDTTGAAGSDGAESAETASEDSVKDNSDTESRAAFIWLIAFAGIAAAAAIGAVAVKKRKEEKQTK